MTHNFYQMYPRTINKKTLCIALGLVGKNGNIHFAKLRTHYLTDPVLEKIGVDPKDYAKIRIFNMQSTALLIEEMDFNPQDFEEKKPEQ